MGRQITPFFRECTSLTRSNSFRRFCIVLQVVTLRHVSTKEVGPLERPLGPSKHAALIVHHGTKKTTVLTEGIRPSLYPFFS